MVRLKLSALLSVAILLRISSAQASITVTTEHLSVGAGTAFPILPGPSANDLAETAAFTSIAGTPADGVSLSSLHDGIMQAYPDDGAHSFYYNPSGTFGTPGSFLVDFGSPQYLSQINTYSRHENPNESPQFGRRAAQYYSVYGSINNIDFAPIATVSNANTAGSGGAWANSITDTSGSLGNYQYLRFDVQPNPWGTFYGEVDVFAQNQVHPKNTYGIFIGSNDATLGFTTLNGTADATKVYEKFNTLSPFTDRDVLLYDLNDASATPDADVFALLDTYTSLVKPGDDFVFFYSGHGSGSKTDLSIPESAYITERTGSGQISDWELAAWFLDPERADKWAAVNKLFIMDSCHSGGFWDGTAEGASNLSGLDHVALLAASGELELALANPLQDWEGFFSSALEDALTKVSGFAKADVDKNGLTVDELKAYLETYAIGPGAEGYIKGDWSYDLQPVGWSIYSAQSSDFSMSIPEPASLGLFAVGVLTLIRRKRTS